MKSDYATAQQHGERLASALTRAQVAELRSDPIRAINHIFGIHVEVRDVRDLACSVAGSYTRDPEPCITIGVALSPGRTLFTAFHELGHHLAYADGDIKDWCFDRDGQPEEQIANAFAAALIFDDDVVDECIPPEGPTAYSVAELFDRSPGSREACCVRACHRFRTSGAVAVVRNSVIQFAARRGLPFYIARDLEQDENSLFGRACRAEGAHSPAEVTVRLGPERYSETFFADAYTVDGYTFMVLASDNPPWGGLAIPPEDDRPEGPEYHCLHCDRYFESVWRAPCPQCGDPRCPACDRCSCEPERPAVRRCATCNVDLPRATPPDVIRCDYCA